jgi:hypothetical protein
LFKLTAQFGSDCRHTRTISFGSVQVALGNVCRRAGGADLGHDARVGTDAPPGFTGDDHYTSTAVSTNLSAFYGLHLMVPTSYQQLTGHSFNMLIKPIRAF